MTQRPATETVNVVHDARVRGALVSLERRAALRAARAATFDAALRTRVQTWSVLRHPSHAHRFAKRRFVLQHRRRRFEAKAANAPVVLAYGDGQSASSVRGCHGAPPHETTTTNTTNNNNSAELRLPSIPDVSVTRPARLVSPSPVTAAKAGKGFENVT